MKPIITWKRRSIGAHIGLLYSFLAIANLLFFLVMIFENQSDILLQLFQYRTGALVTTITKDMRNISESESKEDAFAAISRRLEIYDVKELILLDQNGKILSAEPEIPAETKASVSQKLKDQIVEMNRSDSLFDTRNAARLNEKDFSVSFLIPLELGKERHYVSAVLNVSSMHERLRQIYIQAGIALGWVLLFHVGFAVYIFRLLIRRIRTLTQASESLSDGDLAARAVWKGQRGDELDELGLTFNLMADRIQSNITTIQTLNHRIQQELKIGKIVQSLIVHNRSSMEDYRPYVFVRPLREVSGDVHKFYELPSGMKGFFFGDACGHGISAALITALTITTLDRIVPTILHPGKILQKLADELNESLEGSYYTTAFFLMIDETKGKMYFANAGHIPPLILRPSTGKVLSVEASGPPAGTIGGFEYATQAVGVKSGDLILVCSDGVIEAVNSQKEAYGFERLQALMQANAGQKPDHIGQLITDDLLAFAPQFHDDVTLILMEVP